MFECVSLFVWPNKANYYIFSPRFYFSYQKLKNHCNGNSSQNGAYLYTYSSKSHNLNTVRKPRRSTSVYSTSTKQDSHAPRCYAPPSPKSPNIATVFELTVQQHQGHQLTPSNKNLKYQPLQQNTYQISKNKNQKTLLNYYRTLYLPQLSRTSSSLRSQCTASTTPSTTSTSDSYYGPTSSSSKCTNQTIGNGT